MTDIQIDNAWEIYRAFKSPFRNGWFDDLLWAYAVRCAFAGGSAPATNPNTKKPTRANVARMAGMRKR